MKKAVVYISLILISGSMSAQSPQGDCDEYLARIRKADSLFTAGDYNRSVRAFSDAFLIKTCIRPYHLYNAACAAAKAGKTDAAFAWLTQRLGLEKGWYSDRIDADTDLLSLHRDNRWQSLLDTLGLRQHRIERNFDMPLRKKLLAIAERDQNIRTIYARAAGSGAENRILDSLLTQMQLTDSINLKETTEILDRNGWVGRDKVGNACLAIFLVIQHSESDIQKCYFPLLQQGAAQGDITPLQLAMLEDRIAVGEGRPQRYGSQILRDKGGSPYIAPLLDAERVNEWRREIGMESLTTYAARWGIIWPSPIQTEEQTN